MTAVVDEGTTEAVLLTTAKCNNDYCLSDEDYVDMIRNYLHPEVYEWFFIVVYFLILIVGVCGNSLVCFAVWRNHTMRTVTNYFIVNLAVADILVLLICLPPTLLENITQTWFLGRILCKVVKYFQGVSVSVSVLTLTAISFERFFAICYPLKLQNTRTPKTVRIAIIIIWISSFLLFIPELVNLETERFGKMPDFSNLLTKCLPTWDVGKQTALQLFQMVALFFIPFVLMGFCYVRMANVLWRNEIPTEDGHKPLTRVGRTTTRNAAAEQLIVRRKVAKMLIAVVVIFGLCYLPVHLLNILRYLDVFKKFRENVIFAIALTSQGLCYFNSCVNPIIYNFMSEKFRKAFKKAVVCEKAEWSDRTVVLYRKCDVPVKSFV